MSDNPETFGTAGRSPSEQAQWLERRKEAISAQNRAQQELDRAMCHVFGIDHAHRSEDQRKVWAWLTREMYAICTKDESLAIFEGRRQKGVEAVVAIEREPNQSP